MPSKEQKHPNDKASSNQRSSKPAAEDLDVLAQQQTRSATLIQQARLDPRSLTPRNILQLQRVIGNQAIGKLLSGGKLSPVMRKIEPGKLNVVGETHPESEPRRDDEKTMVGELYNFSENNYWTESEFKYKVDGETRHGDDPYLLMAQSAAYLLNDISMLKNPVTFVIEDIEDNFLEDVFADASNLKTKIEDLNEEVEEFEVAIDFWVLSSKGQKNNTLAAEAKNTKALLEQDLAKCIEEIGKDCQGNDAVGLLKDLKDLAMKMETWKNVLTETLKKMNYNPVDGPAQLKEQIKETRSLHMYMVAEDAAEKDNKTGVWKVGERHVKDMEGLRSDIIAITTKEEFDKEYKSWAKRANEFNTSGLRLFREAWDDKDTLAKNPGLWMDNILDSWQELTEDEKEFTKKSKLYERYRKVAQKFGELQKK